MNRPLIIWQFILDHLQQEEDVMLLYVLESKGSSPGRQGFFMAITASGEMQGSIGGGVMEHKFVELARERLKETKQEKKRASIRRQVHDKKAAKNRSGMICSGEQTILLHVLMPCDGATVQSIVHCLQQQQDGSLQLSPAGLSFSMEVLTDTFFDFYFNSEEGWLYKEKLRYKNHLYIIGGGHCALAFSRLMSGLDFCIYLYDDREGLNTFEQNSYAHHKFIVNNYTALEEAVSPGPHTYVVVMTVGYRTDDMAVRALLKKELAYFGLLGSKSKIQRMFADYRKEGIEESLLQKIHAPVGLPINSQTPEEIAISIAAQIIQVKNKREKSADEFPPTEVLYLGKL